MITEPAVEICRKVFKDLRLIQYFKAFIFALNLQRIFSNYQGQLYKLQELTVANPSMREILFGKDQQTATPTLQNQDVAGQ